MYQEYWELSEAPFDNVPDPAMYFRMHASVENAIAELLFAIEEGNECLALLIGDVGLGKTMALRVVLDKLEHGKYKTAFVTNPDLTFPQLMREVIGQLQGEDCELRSREELLEQFNRFLVKAAGEQQKVLLFIDEGQALRGPVLESMRLLTSIQENKRNLLTIILAGQPELGTLLTHPKRANLLQRVGVCPILEPLGSEDLVGDYIDHRMERAGSGRNVFTNSGIASIYECSKGVPRLINRFCKLCLKAGETNRLTEIDAEVVGTVANQFQPSRLLQNLADSRGAKEVQIQQSPDERPADDNAEAVTAGQESIPVSESHPGDGMNPDVAYAIEPDREVPTQTQADEEAPYPELELEPDLILSVRLPSESNNTQSPTSGDQNLETQTESAHTGPRIGRDRERPAVSEEHPADHKVEEASSSQESIPESESHPNEGTHAIKSDCRVSAQAQLDEKRTHPEPGSDPEASFYDSLPSEPALLAPEEPLTDHNAEVASASREPIPGSESHTIEGTHAIKSDCQVSIEAPLEAKLPHQEPVSDPVMDFFNRLPSELDISSPAEHTLGQDSNTQSQTHLDQDTGAETENLDIAAKTETQGEPPVAPGRSDEQVSDRLASSDPVEELWDQASTAKDAEPPAAPPSSNNGGHSIEWERRPPRSKTHSTKASGVSSTDDNLGQLRQRIAKSVKPGRPSGSWVKSLFRGVLW